MAASAVEDDLTPARWNFTRTRGDVMKPTTFRDIKVNGTPVNIDVALAQVRAARDRDSPLILDLNPEPSGDQVVVGDGVELDAEPGTYWWDLQIDDLTIVYGTFRLLNDVSEEGS